MSSRNMALRLGSLTALTAMVGIAGPALGTPITDKLFFEFLSPTVINFETNGAGAPVNLIQGQIATMPANEYASKGVRFNKDLAWANDGNAQMDAAQFLGGSPVNSMPSSVFDTFTIHFDVPVKAFGFFVANNRLADPSGPSFTAYDDQGDVIETVNWGAAFVDAGFSMVDYGFMGLSSPEVAIARVEISKDAAILDDLTFSVIPAPGAMSALAGAGLLGLRRRRR